MPAPVLFVSDLDGTLLNGRGELSSTSRRALYKLLERGVQFTLASARSHFSIQSIFGDLPFQLPIIEFNGAYISDYQTGHHLHINALDEVLSRAVLEIIVQRGLRPFISSFDGSRDHVRYDELINYGMSWYEERRRAAHDPRLSRAIDLTACLNESVVSFTVMTEDRAALVELRHDLDLQFGEQLRTYFYENEYSKGTWWLTIHAPRASKQLAMQVLRDEYLPGATIVAFGDNHNDIEMIRLADRGIAVRNAIAELTAVADEIIGSNEEDSVVNYLMKVTEIESTLSLSNPA